jgi:hypothetical protein
MTLPEASALLVYWGAGVALLGLLLRFRLGRISLVVALVGFLVLTVVLALFTGGDLPDFGGGADGNLDIDGNKVAKVGGFLLYSSGGCFAFALFFLLLHLLGVK